MTPEEQTRTLFAELRAGDRIEITHEVKVGLRRWPFEVVPPLGPSSVWYGRPEFRHDLEEEPELGRLDAARIPAGEQAESVALDSDGLHLEQRLGLDQPAAQEGAEEGRHVAGRRDERCTR